MFAIVDIGGKQYRAEVGRELVVDRLDAEEGPETATSEAPRGASIQLLASRPYAQ